MRQHRADLIVLDLGLPDIDGLEVIRRIRDGGVDAADHRAVQPRDEAAKVTALDLGADDYVTKPFGIDELLARIRAAQRHRLQQQGEKPIFRTGDLTVDLVRRIVTVRGQEVKFSPREYDLLRLLVAHAGKVLTHNMILREVWGPNTDVQYLRIYVRALRQKIERDTEKPEYILTETGVGYRLQGARLMTIGDADRTGSASSSGCAPPTRRSCCRSWRARCDGAVASIAAVDPRCAAGAGKPGIDRPGQRLRAAARAAGRAAAQLFALFVRLGPADRFRCDR